MIVLSCGLAHLFPYQLLLFSYSILGPAHYLTQISWLHDRNYFARAAWAVPLLIVLTALLMFSSNITMSAIILVTAITSAAALVLSARLPGVMAGVATGIVLGALLATQAQPVVVLLVVLLPTVMHIFIFTASFMWVGALKSGQRGPYVALIILMLAAATFLLPGNPQAMPTLKGLLFFQPIVDYLHNLLPERYGVRLFGFLAFAYTYHYLNWFAKSQVIRWSDIPRERLWLIIAIYLVVEIIYACNYTLGFMLVLFLSLLHVVLEFPLNIRTFSTLGRAFLGKAR